LTHGSNKLDKQSTKRFKSNLRIYLKGFCTLRKNQIYRIHQKAELLIQLPLAGKAVEEINDRAVREIIEGNYRIVYRIESPERIDILAVHHGARSLKRRKIK
jgi:toxin ParE1/3/4